MVTTGKGDGGESQTLHGNFLPKNHILFQALGSLDELNGHLGILRVYLRRRFFSRSVYGEQIKKIQNILVELMGLISNHPYRKSSITVEPESFKEKQESIQPWMDSLLKKKSPPTCFFVPGKNICESQANLSRILCRKAETEVVSLIKDHGRGELKQSQIFLNRLSDYLYLLSINL